jgi:hypothetical protein
MREHFGVESNSKSSAIYSLVITDEESHVSTAFRYGWLYQEGVKVQSTGVLFNYMYMAYIQGVTYQNLCEENKKLYLWYWLC